MNKFPNLKGKELGDSIIKFKSSKKDFYQQIVYKKS